MPDEPKGVQHSLGPLPPVPPGPIASMLKQQVHHALSEIPEGKQGALVGIASESGVNIAVAHRVGNKFQVIAWFGRKWEAPIEAGVSIKASW